MSLEEGVAKRGLHVLVLFAFALAQPTFDLLERAPEFLVAHRVGALDLAVIAFGLVFVVPGAFIAAKEALQWLMGPRVGAQIHLATVALLATAIAMPVVGRIDAAPPEAVVGVAAALGLAAAAAYARFTPVRSFLTVLSVALVLFPLLFLTSSPVAQLLEAGPAGADSRIQVQHDVPVVVVIFDALPLSSLLDESGAIDPRRTPHLAELAAQAHWFRNATAVATFTEYAVPALLTGNYPVWKRPPAAAAYPQSLFTLLGGSHDLNVLETYTRLCPEALCTRSSRPRPRGRRIVAMASDLRYVMLHFLLPKGWRHTLPPLDTAWRNFGADEEAGPDEWVERVSENRDDADWVFSRFLEGVRASERPGLHLVHLMVPHSPLRYLPSGREYRARDVGPSVDRSGVYPLVDEWIVTQELQRHLLQVGYADSLVGLLRERLEQEGLFDRALLIVTADHGRAFRPGLPGRVLADDDANAVDVLSVPLLVKLPGQREGSVSDRNVETVDVLPTILGVLGAVPPQPLDGSSLLETSGPERPTKSVTLRRARYSGPPLRLPQRMLGRSLPGREAVVQQITRRFDWAANGTPLLDVGPHRGLLGRRVDELELRAASLFRARIDDPEDYRSVNPEAQFVPVLVGGRLEGSELPGTRVDLAVAVNGVIRAVTRTQAPDAEGAVWNAMLPEDAFRRGENQIDVFVAAQLGDALVLTPVPSAHPNEAGS